jgi:hypothetical protein
MPLAGILTNSVRAIAEAAPFEEAELRARMAACSICGMRLGDRIVVDDRTFIVRGVDSMSVDAPRVYLEDAETGEMVVDLMTSVRAVVEDECDGPQNESAD